MSIVEVEELGKQFGAVKALKGLNLHVDGGEILGLLGPNGAGKTTTINILTTLVKPDAGAARIDGVDVTADPAYVRSCIGLTGQFATLDANLTARENLVLFGRLLKLGKKRARERADELLNQFDLTDAANRRCGTFSGGMRRRLDLAASMVGQPKILFLDEPTTGLDPRSRNVLWNVVRGLRDNGTTIVLTTQYLAEADELADRIVVIDHGSVIAEGTAAELKELVTGSMCHIGVSPADVDKVELLLANHWQVTKTDDGLAVPSDGPHTLVDVVRILDENQITPDDLRIRQPTLDDVFLALTGHAADAEESE